MRSLVRAVGRASDGALSRLAGGFLSVPLTIGFVVLGIAVVVGRGLRAGVHALVGDHGGVWTAPPRRRMA